MNINGTEVNAAEVVGILDKLSIQRFLLAVLFGIGAIMMYAMWEQRTTAFNAISTNPVALYIIAAGFGMLAIGAVIAWIVSFVRGMNETLYRTLRDQITDLRTEVAQVEARERECNAMRISDRGEFKELLSQLRDSGALPDRRAP